MLRPWSSGVVLVWLRTRRGGEVERTLGDTLEVVVGLGGLKIDTDVLVIDFVLDIGEQNEGCNHTTSTRGLQPRSDTSVPHVCRRRKHSSDGILRHGEEQAVLVSDGLSIHNPIRGRGITKVLLFWRDALWVLGRALPCVFLVLADWSWHARVDAEGGHRVASSQAESAYTALSVLCTCIVRRCSSAL